jgi:geranylgeranyl pyrophosphate synthase
MQKLTVQVQKFIREYGENAYQIAKASLLADPNLTDPVKQVLKYFVEESWPNRQHPALISLACETVGGKRNASDELGAAMVLLTGAADIHDDIIDKSKVKGQTPTAYGRFSQDTVLLAGDILLLKALTLLGNACEKFPPENRRAIRKLVEEAFVEIGCATAKERKYKGNFNLDPTKYWEIIKAKGAVTDAFARVGAVAGNAKPKEVEALGHFGRSFGILMAVKYEFADLCNPAELWHRVRNETLPLPLLFALQDESVKNEILGLLHERMTWSRTERILDLALSTKQVRRLKREMRLRAKNEETALNALQGDAASFVLLLHLSVMLP